MTLIIFANSSTQNSLHLTDKNINCCLVKFNFFKTFLRLLCWKFNSQILVINVKIVSYVKYW